jgi:hypothetical protein
VYCQLVGQANQNKRVRYCLEAIFINDQFDNVVFTDETTIALDAFGRVVLKRVWERKLVAKVKHPLSVHIYGGISRRGPSHFSVFRGIMKKEFLVDVLYPQQVRWIRANFGNDHRFVQDNDPKHNSRHALEYLQREGVNVFAFPPSSPDLNPIGWRL